MSRRHGGRPLQKTLVVLVLWAGVVGAQETTMLGGAPSRNAVSKETGLPASADLKSGAGVLWTADLGTEAYAGPIVAGGKVFVGTNNERPRDPNVTGDRGILMAFRASDGAFLWQAVHDKLAEGRTQDWPAQGVCSTPAVVGDRLYYLSNRAELVALDTEGFRDGENDGPQRGEARHGERDADVLWTLDLRAELGVVPHFMAASSPLVVGELIFVVTGNGVGEGGKPAAPKAPSFVAVDRQTGKVRWSDATASAGLLDGAWSSPAFGVIGGKERVVFAGADGWVYAFEPATGKLVWRFDANAPRRAGAERGRESFVAAPVVVGNRVLVGVGRDPEQGAADGRLVALDATKAGDLTSTGVLWNREGRDFSRTLSTVAVADGVAYAADLAGFLHALDLETGSELWQHDAFAAIWGSPLVADGKVYLGDEDGDLAILAAGRTKKVLAEINLGNAIYTSPAARDGVLFIVTSSRLIALRSKLAQ